jgi:hypothetical protein
LEKIDPVAYIIPLLASMIIHNVFHVSLLEKYVPDPNHVIDWTVIEVEHEGEFLGRIDTHPRLEIQSS